MVHPLLVKRVSDTWSLPLWAHFLIKILTGAVVIGVISGLLYLELYIWQLISILSILWFITIRVSYSLDHYGRFLLFDNDLLCDLSLHLVSVVILAGYAWNWFAGLCGLILLWFTWYISWKDARPPN
jgi:hypothetical protein